MSATQPSVTLFVNNLNIKIKKDELRRALYSLFGFYGKVLDVVYVRRAKIRTTAFIVFRDLAPATAALRALDGESFYGQQLKLSYAKTPSHATIAHHEGVEAVYAIKLGLRDLTNKDGKKDSNGKMIVSSAQKSQFEALNKSKRSREDGMEEEEEEEEEEDSEDGEKGGTAEKDDQGPEKKKGKLDQSGPEEEEEDDAMDEASDDE